jgi:hypothetical protein
MSLTRQSGRVSFPDLMHQGCSRQGEGTTSRELRPACFEVAPDRKTDRLEVGYDKRV